MKLEIMFVIYVYDYKFINSNFKCDDNNNTNNVVVFIIYIIILLLYYFTMIKISF